MHLSVYTNMKKLLFLLPILLLIVFGFTTKSTNKAKAISHKQWSVLLKRHVNNKGDVNYKGFLKDEALLNGYLKLLSDNPPDSALSNNEKFAYWINAYNAFTVKLIIENYPLKSIKDLGSNATKNSPWDKKFFKIGVKEMTLNNIEHDILRKQFNDPRLHFAINCASYSCPKLLNKAFEAATLNQQLNERAVDFLNDPTKNIITPSSAKLSSILLWYGEDFTKTGVTKIEYINRYSRIKILPTATIDYLKYNWGLNEQK